MEAQGKDRVKKKADVLERAEGHRKYCGGTIPKIPQRSFLSRYAGGEARQGTSSSEIAAYWGTVSWLAERSRWGRVLAAVTRSR